MDDEFTVPATLAGERVDRAVALLTGFSRSDVQDLVARREVLVDGRPVAKNHRLHEGEVVEVTGAPTPKAPPSAEPMDLSVRYEDDALVIIAKPAGLVVHPGAGNEHGTLVHGLLHRWPDIAEVGDRMRPGIVHRLDRDTSGLLAVARTPETYEALVTAMAARSVERRYLALVWGSLDPAQGVIDAPVGRSTRRPTKMAVTPRGRRARTHYSERERFGDTSLLELTLETGRTHQIRVHLAALDRPVVGDPAYGGNRGTIPGLERPFLHAYRLGLDHPVSGDRIEVEEPLPPELESVLATLRGAG